MTEPATNLVESRAAVVRQGFSQEELALQNETAAQAMAAAAKATIEARYILAIKRPRDWDVVRANLLKECQRPGFAAEAIYRKPVGKKKNEQTGEWEQGYVEGLSVRYAESAIRCMTNIYWSSTSIYDDPMKAIVRVTVMDLEANDTGEIDVTVEKTVERRQLRRGQVPIRQRVNSYGDTVFLIAASDDEVLNKINNLVSKALRNGVLRIVPGDLRDECEATCRRVQADQDAKDPDAARRKLFDAFSSIGVNAEALKTYLGHGGDLQPKELAELRAIYAAIRDGETTWAAVMDGKNPGGEAASGDGKKTAAGKALEELSAKHEAKKDQGSSGDDKATPAKGEQTELPAGKKA